MMPPIQESKIVTMGEGSTPLIHAKKFGTVIEVPHLYCKIEGQNPSGSFKDRAASLGLSLAMEWNKPGVYTASSGNAAAAVSAYSARAGIQCIVMIRHDSTLNKLGQIAMYAPKLLRVKGIFQNQKTLAQALETMHSSLPSWLNHFVWAPYNPLFIDGLKTIAYEIAEDSLGERLPDCIFVPTAGGDLLYAIYKGFNELRDAGAIDQIPRMVVAQGLNASPTVAAVESGSSTIPETEMAETIAGALRVNFGAEHSLIAIKETGGFGVAASDEEILDGQRNIASMDGIFTEVSSATALAAIAKSVAEGKIQRDEKVVAILTGNGFKDYYPPFKDVSSIPLAESIDTIPEVLKSGFNLQV